MPVPGFFNFRREVQVFLQSCEHLLATASTKPQLTKEELQTLNFTWLMSKRLRPFPVRRKTLFPFLNFRPLHMSAYRQSVQDYIRACQALLRTKALSDAEVETIEVMVIRLSETLLNNGMP